MRFFFRMCAGAGGGSGFTGLAVPVPVATRASLLAGRTVGTESTDSHGVYVSDERERLELDLTLLLPFRLTRPFSFIIIIGRG